MKYKFKRDDLELNLAPMIDVVFLLLIFFIVASTLNLREVKSNIRLPDTQVVEEKKETEVNISVTKKGKVYLGKERVRLSKLEDRLRKKLANNSVKTLTVFADKEVAFQKVIRVMDIAKKIKVKNLNFALHKSE
ncbi:ExbD/TolR family protein [Sporohalobacter salinus]|uniref:ExbD/TolR family protein n=1 Tax=Sporohalobacter salinus TaxID=1494606 RepID=UPI001960A7EC|nr:biopolymer transporter ExbD [Sporohalobacter salinus]MBM7624413.1 biopolymer transport protein ExbD [Sporohalobacter salinus]